MPEWTPWQLQAITARNREILVSAAAGSGKTAVLIERVMSLLREGGQLDRMLVMTFTHAAADEMKERLTDLLSQGAAEDDQLRRQFTLLGRADISTLHSFCQRLLMRYFQAADTDPLSRLADEALAGELFARALDEALDQFYEAPGEEAQALIDRFTEEEITGMVRQAHTFLLSQDAPFEWLDRAIIASEVDSLYSHPWYDIMVREARLHLLGAKDLLTACEALCLRPDGPARYLTAIRDDLALVSLLHRRLEGPEPFTWSKPAYTRLPGKPVGQDEDPALALSVKDDLRARAKELIEKALSLLPTGPQEAGDWLARVRATRPQLNALAGLVKDTHARYQALKAARALWDFNDLEHLALKALQDPGVQAEVSGAYDAIFVDEYQDISRIQEAIIRRLRSPVNALFMVGDVKQSIYRFRLADPSLFLHKQRSFDTGAAAAARLITLKENFRSSANILSSVNLVFEHAMRENATEIGYGEEARLSTLRPEGGAAVELFLIERGEGDAEEEAEPVETPESEDSLPGEDLEGDGADGPMAKTTEKGEMERAFLYEARLIARRVSELVGTPITEDGVTRDIQYRDIAVLLRSAANRAPVMAEIMSARGIPTYSDADGDFYSHSDVRDVLSILEVLDNPRQDLPLLSALASPAFGFSPEGLAALRLAAPKRDVPLHQAFLTLSETDPDCRAAREKLDRWRLMAQGMPLERFLPLLLRESGLYAVAGAKKDGALRRANLRILVSRAEPAPEPQNLADFVERARRAVRQKTGSRSASLGTQENVVRIMTLHKSKGLQFPVVILPDLAASFSARRDKPNLMMDAQTGLALSQIDPVLRARQNGFGVRAMAVKKKREELSEEARLLYVGMTRAKERLILIGAPRVSASKTAAAAPPPGDYAAGSADSMLDWVALPLAGPLSQRLEGLYEAPGGSRWQLSWLSARSLQEVVAPGGMQELDKLVPMAEEAQDLFKPLAPAIPLPQKCSVTSLLERSALLRDEEETPQVKRRPLLSGEESRLPGGTPPAGLSAAQRGAAAHKALCALDPARFTGLAGPALFAALGEALDGLRANQLLSQAEREALDIAWVARFHTSELAQRMAASPERHAEWPFTLLAEEQTILQGVLDACFLEDGAWVLVDYKTDWGDSSLLLARYRDQMRWYMRALRDITGLPVKEAWLYLLRTGEAVRVEEEETIRLARADVLPQQPPGDKKPS